MIVSSKFIRGFSALLLAALLSAHADATSLPHEVRDELRHANIPLANVGILVQRIDSGTPLLSHNAARAMNPASTMKLLTTIAALDILGPAYRWKTEVFLDGKLENGVLEGNLVFKGYGDPKLTIEQFWLWLRELRQLGLREIHGDIVIDSSYFAVPEFDPSEFDNDPNRAYNVAPNALLLNFNALHLRLIPNGGNTNVYLEPDLSGYSLTNRITTVARAPCSGGDNYGARLEQRNIVLEGTIPADCGVDRYLSLLPHDDYFFGVFGALWKELGGTIDGKLREGHIADDRTPFATHLSNPLSELIRDINKFSNNLMARQLFLTLGAPIDFTTKTKNSGYESAVPEDSKTASSDSVSALLPSDPSSATIDRSTAAVKRWLNAERLNFPELVIENGAGLSRIARISPEHLAALLQHAADSRYAAELEASLPILGIDGTLKKRFKDDEMAGYAHLKTGLLDGVKSIAGYVKARSGKRWIVVFLINDPHAAGGKRAQDALIEWVQQHH
ncbi:MAG: D-alanyl-D-alanine carboxypeptidase/D-alanyl-D-alanine-endopeptidase [Gallionella sp.]